ncbi:hypothetical protein [Streptomyces sp. BP-8]|uniref:Uncharacterized protein n=1 Tax=Streptomyces sirii TaxID=3127701 RepID=A0ABZ2QIF2_9ACTN
MEVSRPNGPGTAVKALFDCGEAKLVVTKEPSKDTPPDHDEL